MNSNSTCGVCNVGTPIMEFNGQLVCDGCVDSAVDSAFADHLEHMEGGCAGSACGDCQAPALDGEGFPATELVNVGDGVWLCEDCASLRHDTEEDVELNPTRKELEDLVDKMVEAILDNNLYPWSEDAIDRLLEQIHEAHNSFWADFVYIAAERELGWPKDGRAQTRWWSQWVDSSGNNPFLK